MQNNQLIYILVPALKYTKTIFLRKTKLCVLLLLLFAFKSKAQDSIRAVLLNGYLEQVSSKCSKLQKQLDAKRDQAFASLQQKEEKLKRKAFKIDSTRAKQVFSLSKAAYENYRRTLEDSKELTSYIPYLDTLKTSLKFLSETRTTLEGKHSNPKLSRALSSVNGFESSLSKAESLKTFLKQRRAYLKEQLAGFPLSKGLKKLSKQAYYYNAQLVGYKEAIKDRRQAERKAVEILSQNQQFQSFMQRNSELVSFFRLPNAENPGTVSIQGLQARASINQLVQDRMGNNGNPQALLQQQVGSAQAELQGLKEKVNQYSNDSYSNTSNEIEQPDFKPNSQKTKSFSERLEYGGNIQSQKARNYFPVTSDVGLSLGYNLSDKSVFGIGASYKLGLGRGWNDIAFSHQGVGLRSFLDFKLKGSLFVSGGYEQNYRTLFTSLDQLKDYNAWQSSGLLGLSKKYSVSKKLKGNIQLLWDFLSYQQLPRTQPILFRLGYNFH